MRSQILQLVRNLPTACQAFYTPLAVRPASVEAPMIAAIYARHSTNQTGVADDTKSRGRSRSDDDER
jgi:hypothetical protein